MVECSHHSAGNKKNTRRLAWALVIIAAFMVVEIAGGIISGSLALLADATHMLTDALALALALAAQFLARRPADDKLHFGYRRAQVLAAFTNGILLTFLLAWIVVEALQRAVNPVSVDASLMLWIAIAGLGANILAFMILHRRHEEDLNMRGAVLHVLGDLLGSVAAIVAALVIRFTGWMQIDPILSILVAALIGVSAIRLVRETGYILLEGAPDRINVSDLKKGLIEAEPRIDDIHDVQISQITPDQLRLTMHVCVKSAEESADVLAKTKNFISDRYHIDYSTIQVEVGECPDHTRKHIEEIAGAAIVNESSNSNDDAISTVHTAAANSA